MTRTCTECGRELPLESAFYRHNGKTFGGYQFICKECSRTYYRNWYAQKKAKLGYPPYKHKSREYQLRHHYGLAPEDVPDSCQICGSKQKICVDHCHTSGSLRGFLCDRCNIVLGRCEDDPNLLRQLADYLEK